MECMCAQTRSRFILSSERVLGGMESESMLTPREKSPLPEKKKISSEGDGTHDAASSRKASLTQLPTELFRTPLPPPPPHSDTDDDGVDDDDDDDGKDIDDDEDDH